ncbi:cysteine--tRNA ligase, partial [Candidatus Woesearchaeota archaeon]|nr:cysteine--tRNA ligase [Candidatus Woesearchaeota archaeon]
AYVYPRATKHIKEMVALVKKLLKKDYAYKAEDDSIYYDISKFKDYGKLSKIKLKNLKSVSKVCTDEYTKEQAHDFALWKAWTPKDKKVFWKTEIGKGRPGWHLECSVMSMKYLGKTFDIHTGGVDLIFPHHENEIAQAEAATGKQFVKYWLHNEWLLVEGKKMSKSLGNFYTLRDLLEKGYDPLAIRYVLLSTHYRTKLNFTFKELDSAKNIIERFQEFMLRLKKYKGKKHNKKINTLIKKAKKDFEKHMNNDLNISPALAAVFNFIKKVNKLITDKKISTKDAKQAYTQMLKFDKVLGLKLKSVKQKKKLSKKHKELIKEREKLRKQRKWKQADKIREQLKKEGIVLEDADGKTKWRRVK